MRHHHVTLDMFAPISSVVTPADVPHALAVPAPPVAQFFGTLQLRAEGYTAAMFERLATFEWLWQIGDAALHEAVRPGQVWLIESEVTRKSIQELWLNFPPRELPGASPRARRRSSVQD